MYVYVGRDLGEGEGHRAELGQGAPHQVRPGPSLQPMLGPCAPWGHAVCGQGSIQESGANQQESTVNKKCSNLALPVWLSE